ncbi:dynein heavy chain 8, axonemal [Grus japonensis]|uniref:Dynein heavy chain 8, axonemal n=1 Tax=Grus japonensis TaxID=30415 RepID=A0ABC9WR30_GRUJA
MEVIQKNNTESSNAGEDAGLSLAATNSAGPNLTAESSVPAAVTPEDVVVRSIRQTRQIASFSSSRESLSAASRKLSRFCRSTSGVLSLQEALKEKQARYKEAREYRRTKIDALYKYIFEVLSVKLGLDLTTVEEMILDAPSLEAFDSFFAKGGSKTLKIFYQEGEAPEIGAIMSIEGTVELKKIDYINFSKLQSFEKVSAAANNPDMVHQLEEVLMIWYRQIEQVLIESKQMRKEADDSGPLTELEHWKYMSAKFNFIIEQIKGPNCKAVINVLNVGHSKLLRMWQELDARITDAANESKDNVKYLCTLEKVCQPLYNYDIVSMTHGIPNLINAIRMIHSVSGYYNTSERMTSLFIKDCMFLLKEYQKCFRETKQEILETLGEKTFEVSEMYIFGKSEAFCRRLEKITEMITVVQTFCALNLSTIEGIDNLAVKFKNIYQSVQKKQYDILDPRKTEFDVDFVNFMAKTEGLELYQIQKDDPPLARNMPPVAGKILWKKSNILASSEGKAVVRLYNKIAYVLVEFEVVYHNAWMKEISQLQYPLQATIFACHPVTGKFLVNFDPQILEIIRETKCMIKLGLEVPEKAKKIVKIESDMKSNKLRLEVNLKMIMTAA